MNDKIKEKTGKRYIRGNVLKKTNTAGCCSMKMKSKCDGNNVSENSIDNNRIENGETADGYDILAVEIIKDL